MARFVSVRHLLLALTLAVFVTYASAASTAGARRSMSATDEESSTNLYLNERGELDGDLFDKRGEMVPNPRVNLKRRPADDVEKRQQPGFSYGSQKVRGVNIGGWLVAEPWITPSLFDNTGDSRVVDEYTFGKYVKNAGSRLESHWATFITADDFAQIAAAGLNHVRIPIGYWALDKGTSSFYQGSQYSYLQRAVGWAQNNGLKVVIDLHGVAGSQNGFDNSGRKITPPRWFNQESYKTRALSLLQRFAQDFASNTNTVTAIQLVNEPLTTSGPSNALSFTRDYYNRGYSTVRNQGGTSNFAVMIHDGFQQLSYWNGAYPSPQYQQVLLDTHPYSVFDNGQIAFTMAQRLQYFCNMKGTLASSNANLWTVAGEWTAATTDCAKYLNGRGVGSRYDGTYPGSTRKGNCAKKTGSGSSFSATYKNQLKQMFDTQRKVYESAASGWISWTWKTESAADWDYQKGLAGGWITRNLDDFSGAAC